MTSAGQGATAVAVTLAVSLTFALSAAAQSAFAERETEEPDRLHAGRAQVTASQQDAVERTRFDPGQAQGPLHHAGAVPLEAAVEARGAADPGGRFVYGSDRLGTQTDRVEGMRFVFGKARRSDFTLLAAEEEDALWRLREDLQDQTRDRQRRERAEAPAALGRSTAGVSVGGRLRRHRSPSITWPRVIDSVERVCVPELAYAGAEHEADWREHLVCWLKGDGLSVPRGSGQGDGRAQ